MSRRCRRFSAEFKFPGALEAAKGAKTLNGLCSQYGVHPDQIGPWKGELLESGATPFSGQNGRQQRHREALRTRLYQQIGRMKVEVHFA